MKNKDNILFEEIFSEEIISNESFRSKVLAGIIGFLIVVVLLISLVFEEQFKDISQFPIIIQLTLIILGVIFIRALVVSRAARRWNRYGVKAFIAIRYCPCINPTSRWSSAVKLSSRGRMKKTPEIMPQSKPVETKRRPGKRQRQKLLKAPENR